MTSAAPLDLDPPPAGRRRVPMALITWAFMALVLLIVVVLIALKVTRGGTTVPPPAVAQAPAAVVRAVTALPASTFDAAATPAPGSPSPEVLTGQPPLTAGGLPQVVFVGAEFSPYSAAARWALVAALGRFGTFRNLGATSSSPAEVFPRTATFTFDGASYRSPYVSLGSVETHGGTLASTSPGGFPVLHAPTGSMLALLRRYDGATPPAESGEPPALPFLDVANRVLFVGAGIGFSPGLLRGRSMSTIAAALSEPSNPVSRGVLGAADRISAAVCAADGERPGAVCASPGVRAAAAQLGIG